MADNITEQTLRIIRGSRLGEQTVSRLLDRRLEPKAVLGNALAQLAVLMIEDQSRFRSAR